MRNLVIMTRVSMIENIHLQKPSASIKLGLETREWQMRGRACGQPPCPSIIPNLCDIWFCLIHPLRMLFSRVLQVALGFGGGGSDGRHHAGTVDAWIYHFQSSAFFHGRKRTPEDELLSSWWAFHTSFFCEIYFLFILLIGFHYPTLSMFQAPCRSLLGENLIWRWIPRASILLVRFVSGDVWNGTYFIGILLEPNDEA